MEYQITAPFLGRLAELEKLIFVSKDTTLPPDSRLIGHYKGQQVLYDRFTDAYFVVEASQKACQGLGWRFAQSSGANTTRP